MLDAFESLEPPAGGLRDLRARLARPPSRTPWVSALILISAAVLLAVIPRPQGPSTLHLDQLARAQLGWGEAPPVVNLSSHPNRVTDVGGVVYVERVRGGLAEHDGRQGGESE